MLGHIPPHLTSSYRLRKSLNHYKCMKKQRYYNGIVDIFNYSEGRFLSAKFVTLFFLVLFLAIAPATASPLQEIRITIQRTNVPLGEIFKEIEQKTDYSFLIRRNDVDTNRKVSLNAPNKSVAEILGMLFDNQGIDYKVDGKRISVYKAIDKEGQPRKVTGRVVDAAREPVIGASVVIEGTSMGTITDIDGNFSLEVSDDNVMLTISYIGYKTHNVRVQGKNNINVVLQEDSKALDEVVVVGYGTQKKVNLTGSVETVKSDKIAGKPVTSLQEALTGEAAGMTITQTSGQPGRNSTSVRIRGVGTWGDADPLVLVDGVAMNMEDVMPSDVESISVLKDAASAAIYGSRAANGVILITTKQGKKGKVSINYSGNVGIQRATRVPKMAKSWQYAELYNQSMENEGKSSTLFPQDRIDRMKAGGDPDVLEGSTDWFDEILHPAVQHSHNVTVQGGSEKTSYIGSLGYTYQNGVIFSSYKRYNARINTTTDLTSWFKVGMNLAYINDISSEQSEIETESWTKLIRVLIHEIMNTVTPIASLSHTLSMDITSSENKPVNREELKLGLDTISESARGLIKFVDTYRSLTRVSAPVKKAFYLQELIDRVTQLTREQISASGATLSYVEKSEDILLYADEDQISQVLVNLIRNAIQAKATTIDITAEIDLNEAVIVNISNNGNPISKENYEDIFVPFYTTKQEGTGVGLSLSRQIMRLHNGSISLVCSNEKNTVFKLQFK